MGSLIVHIVVVGLVLVGATFSHQIVQQATQREIVTLIAPSPDSYALQPNKKIVSGGGGGGDHDPLPAPKGRLPKLAMEQITPPQIVVRNEKPRLTAEPTVVVPPQVHIADNHIPNLGTMAAVLPSLRPRMELGQEAASVPVPVVGWAQVMAPASAREAAGASVVVFLKSVAAFQLLRPVSTPDPEYTEEARRAKSQGTCILWLIVDAEGHPRDIRVVRGLGFGLDTKAIEAVRQWRFQPAMKDGKPVNVQISVEVGFRLY